VARQSLFELQELPKKCFLLSRNNSISEAYWPPQRTVHSAMTMISTKIMKPGVAGARILQILETSRKPSMRASNRRVLDASARIDSPKDRKAKLQCQTILKCDSPDGAVDSDRNSGRVRLRNHALWRRPCKPQADHPEAPTAIRHDLGAIFISLELSPFQLG